MKNLQNHHVLAFHLPMLEHSQLFMVDHFLVGFSCMNAALYKHKSYEKSTQIALLTKELQKI
jgi:hypothetical protein